jgi:hypothetical protein
VTSIEDRALRNQIEIMWALYKLLSMAAPDLVGRGGEIDRMRDDLVQASKATTALLESSANQ